MKSPANRRPLGIADRCGRFMRDESGQGIIFAAASLVLLVGFVALVYNVGRATERRTKIQLAADAAAYSGAMVTSNSLSAIAWINSAMAQIYYNALKYAVDVNVTGVAAELERRLGTVNGPARIAYDQAYERARQALPLAKSWMVDLSRIENAIAILTPRLAQEEMFAVAKRAQVDRLSFFPSFRLFPHPGSSISYRIEQLGNGWRITNLSGGNNEMLYVFLQGQEWHLQYSQDGIVIQEVVITQEGGDRWHIQYFQPPGNLVQEIYIVRTDELGWVVWGSTVHPGGRVEPLPELRFEPVDMDNDGHKEGMRVTQGDFSQVLMRGPEGDLYVWRTELKRYVRMTSSETVIGGVTVRVNVTNEIRFPGATAHIGDPTTVDIGRAHIVLTDPPSIHCGLGPVGISIRGFDPDSFSVSVGGFSLTHGDADGRWRKWYNPNEELWSRHRLTEQQPLAGALKQWQYDHQVIGAHLREEPNLERYIMQHAIGDRLGTGQAPEWIAWFDPITGAPRNIGWRHLPEHFAEPDAYGIRRLLPQYAPPPEVYYLTRPCTFCGGDGKETVTLPDGATREVECHVCLARDHDPNIPGTDVRAFIADLGSTDWGDRVAGLTETDYVFANMHAPGYGLPRARRPLVLAEEFFQYGFNLGAWRAAERPMLFPQTREPQWGVVAIACARLGIPDLAAEGGYRHQFDSQAEREDWCQNVPQNLYLANIVARLYPAREQMRSYDLDYDILQGISVRPAQESPTSYLWDAVLRTGYAWPYEPNNWLAEFEGRTDPRVGEALRHMRDRQGRTFDVRDGRLDEVVEH